MNSIEFQHGSNLGSLKKIYFVETEGIDSEPRILNLVALDDIVLKEGFEWKHIYSTRNKPAFSESQNISGSKIIFNQTISGYIPKSSPALAANLSSGKHQRYAVLALDSNNVLRWIGTKKNPCIFNYNLATGSSIIGGSGYTFSFTRQSSEPAPSYDGIYEVDGSVNYSNARRTLLLFQFLSFSGLAQSFTVGPDQEGLYTHEKLDANILTTSYKINTVAKVLPFELVDTDLLEITITRTDDEINSSLQLTGVW